MDAALSGAPGFTLIAIVVALAAYLRNVSSTSRDKIESIVAGRDALWAPGTELTKERLKILGRTRGLIKRMTHVFFALSIAVGARLCVGVAAPRLNNWWVYGIDIGIVASLTLALLGMWIAHWLSRAKDDVNFDKMMSDHEPIPDS